MARRSISQSNSYERCPQAWAYRYQQGLRMAPSWAIRGRNAHKAVEANFSQKIETRQDLQVADVLDVFRAGVEESFTSTDEEVILGENESKDRIVDEGVLGLKTHHIQLAPGVQPILVEERIEAVLPGGDPILGILDLVDETSRVRDTKFTTDSMRVEALLYEKQPPIYAWLYEQMAGERPAGVTLDVVSLGRKKVPDPKAESLSVEVNDQAVAWALENLESIGKAIDAGIVYRRASPMNCNGCGYRRLCWGNGQPRVVSPPLISAPVPKEPPAEDKAAAGAGQRRAYRTAEQPTAGGPPEVEPLDMRTAWTMVWTKAKAKGLTTDTVRSHAAQLWDVNDLRKLTLLQVQTLLTWVVDQEATP